MDEITLDGKTYVSSKRAAQITGYAKDYVGQLCREGRVEARLVGRNWYILESSIREHRFGKEPSKPSAKDENGAWLPPKYAVEDISSLPVFESNEQTHFPEAIEASLSHSDTVQEMQNAWQDWFSRKEQPLSPQTNVVEEEFIEEEVIESETPAEEPQRDLENNTKEMEEVVRVIRMKPEPAPEVFQQPEYKAPKTFNDIYQAPQEETVSIQRSYGAIPAPSPRPVIHQPQYIPQKASYASPQPEGHIVHERRVTKKKKPSMALQALFLVLAAIAIAIALIGSGQVDNFLNKNRIQYGPINFLGGEDVVNK